MKSDILIPKSVYVRNNIVGTLQGGILSPLLSNIYFDKFDKFIEDLKLKLDKGQRRASNLLYTKLVRKYGAVKLFPKEYKNISSVNPFDKKFKRVHYVRYVDEFLIGVIGSKDEANIIRNEINLYFLENLGLELNMEKTLITHRSSLKKFLGYIIGSKEVMYKISINNRIRNGRRQILTLFIDKIKVIKKLCELGYCDKSGKPLPNFRLLHQTQSLSNLNAVRIIIGLNAYYKLANNRNSVMNSIVFIIRTSLAKMYAAKYKKQTIAAIYKVAGPFLHKRIRVKNPLGATEYKLEDFSGSLEKLEIPKVCLPRKAIYNKPDLSIHANVKDEIVFENIFKNIYNFSIRGTRAINMACNICGSFVDVEMHHVRKLSDIKSKDLVSKAMIASTRKQIPLCRKHHYEVHGKKYKG